VLKVFDACNQATAIRFIDDVFKRLPFRVLVVQTDNGAEFQSRFHWHLEARDIRHVYIRPRTPHLNGKVERSHRVEDQDFYQLTLQFPQLSWPIRWRKRGLFSERKPRAGGDTALRSASPSSVLW